MSEGFEGGFPTGVWSVFDYDGAFNGEYLWGADDFKPHTGSFSAWPARGGQDGVDPQSASYPNNCKSWMTYGPFDLSGSTTAEVQFYYWNISELQRDTLSWGASDNGTSYDLVAALSGDSLGWQEVVFDLTSYAGDSSVWIAFIFQSDASGTFQGPFVDDIVLRVSDPSSIFADGFESGDASAWSSAVGVVPPEADCDPVANSGCPIDDRCTFRFVTENPYSGYLVCTDEGTVPVGGACTIDSGTGIDDCVGGSLCIDGKCEENCTVVPDSCVTGVACSHTDGIFDDTNIGTCAAGCDIFAQDCAVDEACYLLTSTPHSTVCVSPAPEPDVSHNGCVEIEKLVPQEHGECCSFINTCNYGLGCIQVARFADGLVCAEYCDPTGMVGTDDCVAQLGLGFYCIALNEFYSDLTTMPDHYGMCLEESLWGPPTCFNGIQDLHEDGTDCCSDGGDPECPCAFGCG